MSSTRLHCCRLGIERLRRWTAEPARHMLSRTKRSFRYQRDRRREQRKPRIMTSPIAGGVDCDLHPAVPHLTSLLPYLNDYWRDQVTTRGMTDLVSQSYPSNSPITARPDWRPSQGKPGSSLEDMRKQALDPFKVSYG